MQGQGHLRCGGPSSARARIREAFSAPRGAAMQILAGLGFCTGTVPAEGWSMHNILQARLVDEVAVRTADPPCDFCSFVAERRGIARDYAEMVIEGWVASYDQRAHGPRVELASVPAFPVEELLSA